MIYPATITDNFLENPDLVRKYAFGLTYEKSNNEYAGSRSVELGKICPHLKKFIIHKTLSSYHNLEQETVHADVEMYFQMLSPEMGEGLVHRDNTVMSTILYLNKDVLEWGTSLLKLDSYEENNSVHRIKQEVFSRNEIDEEWESHKNFNNNQYTETIRVSSLYNRLLAFDGSIPHRQNNFNVNTHHEKRLIIVSFYHSILTKDLPIIRWKKTSSLI